MKPWAILYTRTLSFCWQRGWHAEDCNELLAKRLLKNTHRLFSYKNIRNSQLPSSDLAAGLTHGPGTITDCINFAYCLGWRKKSFWSESIFMIADIFGFVKIRIGMKMS